MEDRISVYFDLENFVSLVQSSQKDGYGDCCRMLKNRVDVRCNFKKSEINSLSEDDKTKVLDWMKKQTDGCKGNWIWGNGNVVPIRPLKTNVHKGFCLEQYSSVYLISDENISVLKRLGSLLWGERKDEIDVLSKLQFEDYQFAETINVPKMKDWDELAEKLLPCTDIIIIDRYIFSDESLYEYNVYSMLDRLVQKANDFQINIVFITYREVRLFTPKFETIKKEIKRRVEKITQKPPKVTFVTSCSKLFDEHDRTIMTNYQYIHCGDSFNVFDSQGYIITKANTLDIKNIVDESYYDIWKTVLNKVQNFVQEVLETRNKELIVGDRESNFLTF